MFLTVTPNLCIERTIEISDFALQKVHRVPQNLVHLNAGGKGINAARVAGALGVEVKALTWVGKNQRVWFEQHLAEENIPFDLVEVEPDTRICTNILHGDDKKTEIVEAGAPLSRLAADDLAERFEALLDSFDLAAICGSYPPGEEDAQIEKHLGTLCAIAKKKDKKLIVDSKGIAFDELLKNRDSNTALPWAIKPNNDEAVALLGYPVETVEQETRAARDLINLGVEVVLLSCGKRGAYLGTRKGVHFFAPPPVREISAVGSGDSFVGAFAARYLQTGDLIEATKYGCAAGAASASSKLSAFCNQEEIERLTPGVQITKIIS